MSAKDSFTADEWFKVMTGPGQAGAAVVAASPSGVTGLLAEAQAIALGVRENVSRQGRTPLIEAMAADLMGTPPHPKDQPPQTPVRGMDDARERALEGVRQAAWLVSSKASPADAAAYRAMLLDIAERTARAAKEGGFLGFGGEQVNDRERAVLDELRTLLGGHDLGGQDGGGGGRSVTVIQETAPLSPSPDGSGNSN